MIVDVVYTNERKRGGLGRAARASNALFLGEQMSREKQGVLLMLAAKAHTKGLCLSKLAELELERRRRLEAP